MSIKLSSLIIYCFLRNVYESCVFRVFFVLYGKIIDVFVVNLLHDVKCSFYFSFFVHCEYYDRSAAVRKTSALPFIKSSTAYQYSQRLML